MELKVVCGCGQKFKFDVEPVGGRMPFTVNCPVCQTDGTAAANALLAEKFLFVPPAPVIAAPSAAETFSAPPPPIAPLAGGLRINRAHAEPAPASVAAPLAEAPASAPSALVDRRPFAAQAAALAEREKSASFSKGLLGGLIGAFVGALIYLLIFKYTDYHIKLLAVGVGALAGWFADFLGKGEGSKELGGITAVFVLVGILGAQFIVLHGWWSETTARDLKSAQSAYISAVTEAKEIVKAVPTGSDVEIRSYLAQRAVADGEKVTPGEISNDDVRIFRETQLLESQNLASGKLTKEQYEQQNDLKTSLTKEEKQDDENTFKAFFLLFLLHKVNLFSLAAAAGLAFKLSTNA